MEGHVAVPALDDEARSRQVLELQVVVARAEQEIVERIAGVEREVGSVRKEAPVSVTRPENETDAPGAGSSTTFGAAVLAGSAVISWPR